MSDPAVQPRPALPPALTDAFPARRGHRDLGAPRCVVGADHRAGRILDRELA